MMPKPQVAEHAARSGEALLLCITAILPLLVYALSFGPVVRLAQRGVIPGPLVVKVYAPAIWVAERNGTYRRYVNLWLRHCVALA